MQSVRVNGVVLEYEVTGSGEPLLLISPVIADGFLPLLSDPALADRYQLIRYHKRGWLGSTHTPPPVSIADHAADAAALLEHLGIPPRPHRGPLERRRGRRPAGARPPDRVHTLLLLDPSLFSVPSVPAFLDAAGPALEAYESGDQPAPWPCS